MGDDYYSDFVYQKEMNFYLCKHGKALNERSPNCTSYEKLENVIGENISWNFKLYYQ